MLEVKCPMCGAGVPVPPVIPKKSGWGGCGLGCLIAALAIPVLVFVIGILAAIAIPAFVKTRDVAVSHACVNNMHMLDAAKQMTAQDHSSKAGDVLSEQEVLGRLGMELKCPQGGHYKVNPVGKDPACSVHGPMSAALGGKGASKTRVTTELSTGAEPAVER